MIQYNLLLIISFEKSAITPVIKTQSLIFHNVIVYFGGNFIMGTNYFSKRKMSHCSSCGNLFISLNEELTKCDKCREKTVSQK